MIKLLPQVSLDLDSHRFVLPLVQGSSTKDGGTERVLNGLAQRARASETELAQSSISTRITSLTAQSSSQGPKLPTVPFSVAPALLNGSANLLTFFDGLPSLSPSPPPLPAPTGETKTDEVALTQDEDATTQLECE